MSNENVISYVSYGDSSFLCPFKMTYSDEVKVLVDYKLCIENKDYIIKNFAKDNQSVDFFNPIGDKLYPKIVTLKRYPRIVRKTDFMNITQIKPNLLNLEFDNVIDNQKIALEHIENSVGKGSNSGEIILPQYQDGTALIWQDGVLVNSERNINTALDTLWQYMEEAKENGNNGSGEGEGSNGGVGEEGNRGEGSNNQNKEINANEVIYNASLLPAINVEEALHSLTNPKNIFYSNMNITGNISSIKDALDNLPYAKTIHYDNSNSNFNQANNIQEAIESLNSKFDKKIEEIKNQIPNIKEKIVSVAPHIIINGVVDTDGAANHLQGNGNFSLKLVVSESEPLSVAFSNNNEIKLVRVTTEKQLSFSKANIIYYIYIDLLNNGDISIGFKETKPYYLYYNPIVNKASTMYSLDKWVAPSDFFHIPSLTMYDQNNIPINRLYIGQVMFDSSGKAIFINNYCHGNSFSRDYINGSSIFKVINNLGMTNINLEVYVKYNRGAFAEKANYSTNLSLIDNTATRTLKQGYNFNIAEDYINILFGGGSKITYYYYGTSQDYPTIVNGGYARIMATRAF